VADFPSAEFVFVLISGVVLGWVFCGGATGRMRNNAH